MHYSEKLREYLTHHEAVWTESLTGRGASESQKVDGGRQAFKIKKIINVVCARFGFDRAKAIDYCVAACAARDVAEDDQLFLSNIGGCGSHWIASMLEELSPYSDAGEVYVPDQMIAEAQNTANEEHRRLLSSIYALHTLLNEKAPRPREIATARPINSAHGIDNLKLHQRVFPKARFIHLNRDPRDRALSVTYRKQAYRKAAFGEMADRDYLFYNTVRVHKHYHRYRRLDPKADIEIRYEDFVANPIVALDRVLNALPNVASGPMTALIAQAFAADALSGGGGAAAKGNLSGTAGSKWRVHDNADDLRLMHSLLASALEIAQYPLCDCFGERAELQDITGDAQSQHSPIVFNLQSVNRSSAALRRLRLRGLNDATPEQFGRLIDATRPDLLCAADLQGRLTVGHMAQLAVAPDLLELDLANTEVEAAPAGGFATLRRVNLSGSSLGPGGVEAFRRAAPDAEVFFDYESR